MNSWPGGRNRFDRIALDDAERTWRNTGISPQTPALLRRHYHQGMNDITVNAWFWLIRDRLFFDLELDKHDRVLLIDFNRFVDMPREPVVATSKFIGVEATGAMIGLPRRGAVGKKKSMDIEEATKSECDALLAQLNQEFVAKLSGLGERASDQTGNTS